MIDFSHDIPQQTTTRPSHESIGSVEPQMRLIMSQINKKGLRCVLLDKGQSRIRIALGQRSRDTGVRWKIMPQFNIAPHWLVAVDITLQKLGIIIVMGHVGSEPLIKAMRQRERLGGPLVFLIRVPQMPFTKESSGIPTGLEPLSLGPFLGVHVACSTRADHP